MPLPTDSTDGFFLWDFFCRQMGKMNEAIDDCTKAIELDDKYLKAYLRRAKWYVTA